MILSSISLLTILVVTFLMYESDKKISHDYNSKIEDVVSKVNKVNQSNYNVMKTQQQDLSNIDLNVSDMRKSYVEVDSLANSVTTQDLNVAKGVKVTNDNPGPLIEKNYGDAGDRFGVAQYSGGKTRLYAGTNNPGSVSMSLAKTDGSFDDIVIVNQDKNTTVNGNLNVMGIANVDSINVSKPIKIRHTANDWTDNSGLSVWANPSEIGASFGGPNLWSHFPWSDGNTYIRPGKTDGDINIELANNINLNSKAASVSGNFMVHGQNSSARGLNVIANNPGALAEKRYGGDGDRYGVGQFNNGVTRTYAATAYPGKVAMSLAKSDGSFDDIVMVNPDKSTTIAGNLVSQSDNYFKNGINVLVNNPGPLIEKKYAGNGDRYGVGQFNNGVTRTYTATAYPGKVAMSLAKSDGSFDDIVMVNPDRSTNVAGNLNVQGQSLCINNACLTQDDINKIKSKI